MKTTVSVADQIADLLVNAGVRVAFGVASIHNLPLLDALDRMLEIRCVPARGEAGAVNMADGYARSSGALGVAITSTGGGAGNACGALIEALTAGIPLLHITGQIESRYLDRERGFIHETKDQLSMLRAVSKSAYRVLSADTLVSTIRVAISDALTAPRGPVSVEIPIDIQGATIEIENHHETEPLATRSVTMQQSAVDEIASELAASRRPILWLGGGARDAGPAARRLADLGVAVITTQHGRGIVPEDHKACLGNAIALPSVEAFYATCDAMLIVGSRLRGNETLNWSLKLPERRFQIDADPLVSGRSYSVETFANADAAEALERIAHALELKNAVDPSFANDIATLKQENDATLTSGLGDYRDIVETLTATVRQGSVWVRDVTIANSMWANRIPPFIGQWQNVNAVGTGIGQGLPMAIGAALGTKNKTVLITGDGGLALCLGELGTLVQEDLDVIIIVMNDGGYGVIRNIQDARFKGRHFLANLAMPKFSELARTFGIHATLVRSAAEFTLALADCNDRRGPSLIEVDMHAIGSYAAVFAGSPNRDAVKKG